MTSPDRKEPHARALHGKGRPVSESFIRVRSQEKQDAAAFGGRSRHQFWTAGEEKKAGSTPGNSYGCLAGILQAWLIVESGLLYLLDRNEGRENPFKRAWKGAERERRRVACHADEQACSRYVWRRMLPPGGTSASRPPWPCFSNGTYFP